MFALSRLVRKPIARIALAAATLFGVAACEPVALTGGGTGPRIDPAQPVPVALLVPKGAAGGGAVVGRGLENAARLAMTELNGARIDLRVYDTAGDAAQATEAATRAVQDGAQIILGPLYTQSTSAATTVIAGQDINMLSFSNNTAVAGGNVYILGQTFSDTANRLTRFAVRQGIGSVAVVHAQDVAGEAGRAAIVQAAQASGLGIAGVESYALSQEGIDAAGPRIANLVKSSGAQSVFLTANVDSDLPVIAEALPAAGVSPANTRFIGLTRWNSVSEVARLPGLQGGWFALPDQTIQASFDARYRAAYGEAPHPLAGLAYDGIKAIGSLAASGRADALTGGALTQSDGFAGASGVFRLRAEIGRAHV